MLCRKESGLMKMNRNKPPSRVKQAIARHIFWFDVKWAPGLVFEALFLEGLAPKRGPIRQSPQDQGSNSGG